MDTISYTSLRSKLAGIMDKVNEDRKPMLITRQKGEPAVLMSLDEFKSYEETYYLMKSPKNAQRLNAAIEEIEAGNSEEHGIIEK